MHPYPLSSDKISELFKNFLFFKFLFVFLFDFFLWLVKIVTIVVGKKNNKQTFGILVGQKKYHDKIIMQNNNYLKIKSRDLNHPSFKSKG